MLIPEILWKGQMPIASVNKSVSELKIEAKCPHILYLNSYTLLLTISLSYFCPS